MADMVEDRLAALGLTLPQAAAPAANYVPWMMAGEQLHIAGQLPMADGKLAYVGKLGEGLDLAAGQAAARLCALNILAQVKAALGDFARVRQCVKLGGFVNATADFTDHPHVINGASDLMVAALGERGRHARFAVGAASLPFNAAVEIDAVFLVA